MVPSGRLEADFLGVRQFLKKHLMREWLRVVSTDKNTYTLRFYNVQFDQSTENVEDE